MSGGSVTDLTKQATQGLGDFFSNPMGGANSFLHNPGQLFDALKPNVPTPPPAPPAPPDQNSIRQQGLVNQLQDEQRRASFQTNAPQGLLDGPTTASRVLLGA